MERGRVHRCRLECDAREVYQELMNRQEKTRTFTQLMRASAIGRADLVRELID